MTFEDLLPAFLDFDLVPPSTRIDARSGRRVRVEVGDFAGHQAYTPGADLRFLDWNALARSGHKVLRQYDEVEHRRLAVIVDTSPSMVTRLDGLRQVLLLYGFVALHKLDSVELLGLGAPGERLHFEGVEAWPRLRAHVAAFELRDDSVFDALEQSVASRTRRDGHVLLSDFEPEAACARALEACAAAGQSIACVFPRTRLEAGLRSDIEPIPRTLRCVETGRTLDVDTSAALLAAFAAEQREWERRIAGLCAATGHGFRAATLPADATAEVAPWLPFLVPQHERRRR